MSKYKRSNREKPSRYDFGPEFNRCLVDWNPHLPDTQKAYTRQGWQTMGQLRDAALKSDTAQIPTPQKAPDIQVYKHIAPLKKTIH